MRKLKIAIALTQTFADKYEAQALLRAFNNTKEFLAYPLILNNTKLIFGQDKVDVLLDIPTPDIILVREIFSLFKYFIVVSDVLKYKNPKLLLIDNNITKDKYIINKLQQGYKLTQAGLPFPRSIYMPNYKILREALIDIEEYLGSYPILLKHRSAGKGNSIYKIDSREHLFKVIDTLIAQNNNDPSVIKKYYLQEFLKLKADYRVLVIGNKVIGAMQRIPKKGEFRANFSLGGSTAPASLTKDMEQLTQEAMQILNLNFGGVDLVQTKDNKWYILEVNKTPGFQGFSKTYPHLDIPKYFVDFVKQQAMLYKLL